MRFVKWADGDNDLWKPIHSNHLWIASSQTNFIQIRAELCQYERLNDAFVDHHQAQQREPTSEEQTRKEISSGNISCARWNNKTSDLIDGMRNKSFLLEYQIFESLIQTAIQWLYRLPRSLDMRRFFNSTWLERFFLRSRCLTRRVARTLRVVVFFSAATNFSSFRPALMTSFCIEMRERIRATIQRPKLVIPLQLPAVVLACFATWNTWYSSILCT